MILNVVVEEQVYPVRVPDSLIQEADDFFAKMDADMDRGWQMSRDWVDNPSLEQRCQIVGDKMLTAMHQDNKKMLLLLSAYILARVPGVTGIRIDTNGEMQGTELVTG
ncbi:MAG: hypothetical protein R3F42_02005 [Pseudomonadota bacterium]